MEIPDNYQEWSQLVVRYLSQRNVLPYVRDLEYNFDHIDIIWHSFYLFMDADILDTMSEIMSSDPYVTWMYLWEKY